MLAFLSMYVDVGYFHMFSYYSLQDACLFLIMHSSSTVWANGPACAFVQCVYICGTLLYLVLF